MRKSLTWIVTLGLALTAAACGGSSSSSPPPPAAEPIIWAANSNNTLTSYSENAGPDAKPLVTLANPYGQQFLAPAEQAALQGGNLWVANAGGNDVIEISSAELSASGVIKPTLTIANPSGQNYLLDPHGLAFDAKGNLWVSNKATDSIVMYTAQQLTSSPSTQPFTFAPAASIANPAATEALDGPEVLTFDPSGNLWVSNEDNDTVVEYAKAQLPATGAVSPAPQVILSSPTGPVEYLDEPHGLAFDASGNLWVVNSDSDSPYPVVSYSAAQITASGSPIPTVLFNNPPVGNPIFDESQFAVFDANGNLWVTNEYGGNTPGAAPNIIQISAANLGTSGSPVPNIALTNPDYGIYYLYQASCLLFDGSGNLIVTNEGRGYPVIKYSASSITTSGAPNPAVALNNPSAVPPAIDRPVSLTVDAEQDLWAANDPYVEPGSVVEFGAGSIVTNTNNVVAKLTITDPTGQTLDRPTDIRFDKAGNLWVANSYLVESFGYLDLASNLVSYSAASIAAGKPAQTIVISNGNTVHIHRIWPDTEGDIWFAGETLAQSAEDYPHAFVAEYTAAQLSVSGHPTPAVIIDGADYFDHPTGLGFDAVGDLWVFSGFGHFTLSQALGVAYLGNNLSSSSTPVSAITGPGYSVQDAKFDAEHDLLMLSGDNVYEYNASKVANVDTGATIPDADGVIAGPLSGLDRPRALAIDNAE